MSGKLSQERKRKKLSSSSSVEDGGHTALCNLTERGACGPWCTVSETETMASKDLS